MILEQRGELDQRHTRYPKPIPRDIAQSLAFAEATNQVISFAINNSIDPEGKEAMQ